MNLMTWCNALKLNKLEEDPEVRHSYGLLFLHEVNGDPNCNYTINCESL